MLQTEMKENGKFCQVKFTIPASVQRQRNGSKNRLLIVLAMQKFNITFLGRCRQIGSTVNKRELDSITGFFLLRFHLEERRH